MSILAQKPATTPIPVQLSATEFQQFILPHLSIPKRGPKCKLGYHRVFNLILWVLYTGMQWKCLPVPQDPHGKPAIHYTTVYKAVYLVTTDNSSGNHQVKYPYFTTVRRGLHNGIQPVVLPTPASRSRVDLPHHPCRVARRPTPCAHNAPPTQSAPTPTLQRTPTVHRAHPQTAVRGL